MKARTNRRSRKLHIIVIALTRLINKVVIIIELLIFNSHNAIESIDTKSAHVSVLNIFRKNKKPVGFGKNFLFRNKINLK